MVILVDKTKQFGAFLTKARERSGYKSQRRLAIDAGISPATLSRIESGRQKPTPETLKSLSRFLRDVTYEELLEKAGVLEDPSPSEQKGKSEIRKDAITNVFFREWDKASEEKKKRTLEFLKFLNQQDDEESNKK